MRITAFSALALGFGLLSVELSACSNSSDDCAANATCGATAGSGHAGTAGKTGGSGTDAGANSGGTPSTGGSMNTSGAMGFAGDGGGGNGPGACTGDVSDDAACWTANEYGVFVSSDNGDDDSGDGTEEAPFATITKGIASAGGKNVYVCLGSDKITYDEKITLTAANDGLRIYGGFECAGWGYATTRKSAVASGENVALRIQGLKKGVYIENLSFTASNATGTGLDASSYGAFVTDSKGVVFKRVELTAGKGAAGADGKAGTKGANGSEVGAAPVGQKGSCTAPPNNLLGASWGNVTLCTSSVGGDGGQSHHNATNGGDGASGSPTDHVHPLADIQNGGLGQSATGPANGDPGTTGDTGTLATAADALGSFSSAGFVAADGKPGGAGYPGQGGGGGGASKGTAACVGASGGAGGMGGCGGTGGKAGGGGAASVGLMSWNSVVTLEACTLVSNTGGAGGKGGDGGGLGLGAVGGAGGEPDDMATVLPGGAGGRGGNGGPGGSGSGGTGGPSYALVFSGTKPSYDPDTMLMPGEGGAAGPGGSVSGVTAPAGAKGDSQAEFEVK